MILQAVVNRVHGAASAELEDSDKDFKPQSREICFL